MNNLADVIILEAMFEGYFSKPGSIVPRDRLQLFKPLWLQNFFTNAVWLMALEAITVKEGLEFINKRKEGGQ